MGDETVVTSPPQIIDISNMITAMLYEQGLQYFEAEVVENLTAFLEGAFYSSDLKPKLKTTGL